MDARVITSDVPPERSAEAIAAVEHGTAGRLRGLPGFRGAYWLADRSEPLIRAVFFFDTERGAHQGTAEAALGASLAEHLGARIRDAQAYEVVAAVGEGIIETAASCRSLVWQEDPGRIGGAIERIEAQVIPGVRRNAGFQGGFWLADRRTGRCAGFTLWDTAEHLATSGAVGRDLRREPARRGELAILELREYGIVAHTAPPTGP